jgi:hypothetical protein
MVRLADKWNIMIKNGCSVERQIGADIKNAKILNRWKFRTETKAEADEMAEQGRPQSTAQPNREEF